MDYSFSIKGNNCNWTKPKQKEIWIGKGCVSGATTNYGMIYHNDWQYCWNEMGTSNNATITLDEDDSALLLEYYFDKHYEYGLNKDNGEIMGRNSFDHYGWNYYSIDTVREILKDIEYTISMLKEDPYNPQLKERIHPDAGPWFIECSNNIFGIIAFKLSDEEKKNIFIIHRDLFIEFYSRFVSLVRKMIKDNRDRPYFAVMGP